MYEAIVNTVIKIWEFFFHATERRKKSAIEKQRRCEEKFGISKNQRMIYNEDLQILLEELEKRRLHKPPDSRKKAWDTSILLFGLWMSIQGSISALKQCGLTGVSSDILGVLLGCLIFIILGRIFFK